MWRVGAGMAAAVLLGELIVRAAVTLQGSSSNVFAAPVLMYQPRAGMDTNWPPGLRCEQRVAT
ncbi:MAG: hypothetical protein R3B90_23115 [Planctomycetaceae bacterium]